MAGDNVQGGAAVPMGYRDTRIGGNRNGRGDAGHFLKGNTVLTEEFQLFTAPAKEEGVAAF